MRYAWVCVRNTAQLVAIDSNRRLSRTMRNLTELLHRSNLMKCDGYDGYEITTLDMVTIVCFSLTQVIDLV
jgi:IS1 family transposase